MNIKKFKIINEDKKYININLLNNFFYLKKIIDNKTYSKLNNYKDTIDNNKKWDIYKKYINSYELIYNPSKFKNESLSLYNPISRSYFKMIEIIKEFDIINKEESICVACLAESPGGFLEAIINKTKEIGFKYYNFYSISLKSDSYKIPSWNKAYSFLKENNVNISYGIDGTGNLYNIDNIISFINLVNIGTCDLVTADGGFDFSGDYLHQEENSRKLIFFEILTALFLQKKKGNFTIKFFDTFTLSSIKILYFVSCFYNEFYIYKPFSSRPNNSERYIILKDFIGIDYNYLYNILESLRDIDNINDIFDDIPEDFVNKIKKINLIFADRQINSLKKTKELIDNKKELSYLDDIIKNQTKKGISWCKRYNININYDSIFLKNYN